MSLSMCDTLIATRMLKVVVSATRRLTRPGAGASSSATDDSWAALKGEIPCESRAARIAALIAVRYVLSAGPHRPPMRAVHGRHAGVGELACQSSAFAAGRRRPAAA